MSATALEAQSLVTGAGDPETAPIVEVIRQPLQESHTTLRIRLTIRVQGHADIEANAYSSIKRHLLEPVPRPQHFEPETRESNTLAKLSLARYKQAFENYVETTA